jgi:L-ascorbate metabolism protein UlaG (beta-lactamase superfamily)
MKNYLIILTLILSSITSRANALDITWYGTSCFYLTDGTSTILFDPFLSRVSMTDIILFKDIKSVPKIVNKWIPLEKRKAIQAILVSHTHYDHILDIAEVHKGSEAVVYGSNSAGIVAKASGVDKRFLKKIKVGDKFKVGDFEIEVLGGNHPNHILNWIWATGKVDKDFSYPASAFSYKMDVNFSFLIKYKKKVIYFNASTNPALSKKINVDIAIQGLAHEKGYDRLIKEQIVPSNTKIIIPSHHDNLFSPLSKKMEPVFTSDMKLFRKKIKGRGQLLEFKLGETKKVFK